MFAWLVQAYVLELIFKIQTLQSKKQQVKQENCVDSTSTKHLI